MTTEDIIISIFIEIDDLLPELKKHPQAKLYPSELLTIGILMALKGTSFRAFYRWLKRDFNELFAGLPERSRLQRLLKNQQGLTDYLLSKASFFSVLDSYPIELIFPIREGRSKNQVGKKSKDKGRWSVGVKLCWLINDLGQVIAWDFASMNCPDKVFNPITEPFMGKTIILTDYGFRDKDLESIPKHMKFCAKGTWNERMSIETAFSMITNVCNFKKIKHRVYEYIRARLSYTTAMFNILLILFHKLNPDADPFQMSIAEFSL